jgi:hypothetical protein
MGSGVLNRMLGWRIICQLCSVTQGWLVYSCVVVCALCSSRGLLRESSSRLAGCVANVAECLVYNHLFEC